MHSKITCSKNTLGLSATKDRSVFTLSYQINIFAEINKKTILYLYIIKFNHEIINDIITFIINLIL